MDENLTLEDAMKLVFSVDPTGSMKICGVTGHYRVEISGVSVRPVQGIHSNISEAFRIAFGCLKNQVGYEG